MEYINAFWVGGLICALVQILMEKTKLLPGRIMVILVCTGCGNFRAPAFLCPGRGQRPPGGLWEYPVEGRPGSGGRIWFSGHFHGRPYGQRGGNLRCPGIFLSGEPDFSA